MKKIICDDDLLKTAPASLELSYVRRYFGDVIVLFEDRHISKYTLTQSDAEKLRVLLDKVKESL